VKLNAGIGVNLDRGILTGAHIGELRLLEIRFDPDPVGHERKDGCRRSHVIADLKLLDLGYDPVFGRVEHRVVEIDLALVDDRLRALHHRVFVDRDVGVAAKLREDIADILLG
jgi:hypothetical protein